MSRQVSLLSRQVSLLSRQVSLFSRQVSLFQSAGFLVQSAGFLARGKTCFSCPWYSSLTDRLKKIIYQRRDYSGLSDVESCKNDRLKWGIAEAFREGNNIFTDIPLSSFSGSYSMFYKIVPTYNLKRTDRCWVSPQADV